MIRVACTGGGSKGAFYAGVWKAKQVLGLVDVERYGTSIGAVNVILEGLGYNLIDVWRSKMKLKYMVAKMVVAWILHKDVRQAISMKHIYEELVLPEMTFDHLNARTFAMATDVINGTCYTFGNKLGDSLRIAMLASSCYPVMFEPVKHNNTYLVDGGLVNNLPLPHKDDLHPMDTTIVVILGGKEEQFLDPEYHNLTGFKRMLAEGSAVFDLFANQELKRELDNWDENTMGKLIKIQLEEPTVWSFDFSKTEELIDTGYMQAMDILSTEIPPELLRR